MCRNRLYIGIGVLCMGLTGCDMPEPPAPAPHRPQPVTPAPADPADEIDIEEEEVEMDQTPVVEESEPVKTTIFPHRFRHGDPVHTYTLLRDVEETHQLDIPTISVHARGDGALELRIPLAEDEAIWGFGQRFDAFNMRGHVVESWATDGWNRLDTSYFAVPFFISSQGYGLFVNCTGKVEFDIGASDPDTLFITVPENGVELIAIPGAPADVSRQYTELVGRPRAAPDWIYRPWISRNSYLGAYEINRVIRRMRELDMPVGVVVLEAWAEQLHNFQFERRRYPNPITWIRQLNQQGVHVVCWITSSVWTGSEAYRQARDRGYLVLNEDGSEHVVRWLENGRKIDFRIPAARDWWRDMQIPLTETGISGIKTDGGEHMPNPFFHNRHPYYYQKASLDAFADSGRDGVTFSRSGNPLTAGLSLVWAGDQYAEWSRLEAVVRAGLSAALSGYSLWGHDIGGYSGIPEQDLYIRWLQFGVFSPIMQFHGEQPREPWRYDEETVDIARFYFRVRDRLLPFLTQWGQQAIQDGTPIIRPLVWHYPDDPRARTIDSQYLLGPDLLVAPVIGSDHERGIYLPEGEWIDLWTGEPAQGPRDLSYRAALHRIPVFVRAEAHEQYAGLFADEPKRVVEPISVELAAPRNVWGMVHPIRYWRDRPEPERITYRITNNRTRPMPIEARLAVQAGLEVSPRDMVRFTLPAGEYRDIEFAVRPGTQLFPGTYPLRIEVRSAGRDIHAPIASLAISPAWHVLGLLDGNVGSDQALDNQPVRLDATHRGRYGHTIGWREAPLALMRDDGMIDLGSFVGTDGGSTSYLYSTFSSQRPQRVRMLIGSGDAVTVWLNGREIHHVHAHRNPERDEDVVDAVLTSGLNHLLIRISRDLAAHHFYFRME